MTTTREGPISNRRPDHTPLTTGLRTHLLAGGAALFTTGALALWLLPEPRSGG